MPLALYVASTQKTCFRAIMKPLRKEFVPTFLATMQTCWKEEDRDKNHLHVHKPSKYHDCNSLLQRPRYMMLIQSARLPIHLSATNVH